MSRKLLDGLEKVSENEAKKYSGSPHVLHILKFIERFFCENPLSCCAEEISKVKELLDDHDKVKLSQKTSSVNVHITKNKYYVKAKVVVPNDYPKERVAIENVDSNFPRVFKVWFAEQAKEIARRCVEPPLKPKLNAPPFEPRPSLKPSVAFIVDHAKRYPEEICQICKQVAFPEDPAKAVHNEHAAAHVERVYCSHIYHHGNIILILHMHIPIAKVTF